MFNIFWTIQIQIYSVWQKRATTNMNIFCLIKKGKYKYTNIFGLTKKGKYKCKYKYSDCKYKCEYKYLFHTDIVLSNNHSNVVNAFLLLSKYCSFNSQPGGRRASYLPTLYCLSSQEEGRNALYSLQLITVTQQPV